MPRKRLVRSRAPETETTNDVLGFIADGLYGEPENENPFPFFGIVSDGHQQVCDAWNKYREKILTDWIVANPCTRPSLWWQFDAPRPKNHEDHETARQHRESQAHFLKRHGQLLSSERRYLGKHPELLNDNKETTNE